ncbi:MAG TPA: class I SAM-dependent methyltransferase [Terriglobia bacterium]|nr:class I SAM-dependent methyltransferase [Terriglobia bacterium]
MEVGSGHSSCVMLDVNELFFNNTIHCTFVDPYPKLLRTLIKPSDRERIRILGNRVQELDVSIFRELGPSDILFIDSSHVAKTGSDVNYIFFKILPLLARGVHVHFHDIFYPFEYPQEWVFQGRSWNEAYMLRAFLQYNRAFKIRFFGSYLIHKHRAVFESQMPLCLNNTGGSFWFEKTTVDSELERMDAPIQRSRKRFPRRIDLSDPEDSWLLGEGWYEAEPNHCWMGDEATLRLAGPEKPGQTLIVRGYSPHVGGVRLTAYVNDFSVGVMQLEAEGPMDVRFPLPATLFRSPSIVIHLSVDRVIQAPGDIRSLGLAVSEIEIG